MSDEGQKRLKTEEKMLDQLDFFKISFLSKKRQKFCTGEVTPEPTLTEHLF
jgi:hypothetical protein